HPPLGQPRDETDEYPEVPSGAVRDVGGGPGRGGGGDMFRVFIILLILVPLLAIWGLAQMGQWIGALPTVLAVIVTSVIGVVLARRQGLEVYRLTVLQLNRGELPSDTLLDGLLILAGGLLLMAPGFFTDTVGFLLMIPYIRGIVRLFVKRWFEKKTREGRVIRITRRW